MIGIDLQKQQIFHADPNAIQINFTGILDRAGNTIFFIIGEEKTNDLDFSQRTMIAL